MEGETYVGDDGQKVGVVHDGVGVVHDDVGVVHDVSKVDDDYAMEAQEVDYYKVLAPDGKENHSDWPYESPLQVHPQPPLSNIYYHCRLASDTQTAFSLNQFSPRKTFSFRFFLGVLSDCPI